MRINCISCGHKVELGDAYDDFEGPVKCLCGAMLQIRTEEGMLKAIKLAEPVSDSGSTSKSLGNAAAT